MQGKRRGTKVAANLGHRRDVQDLMEWERVFGEGFKAVITFCYWIDQPLTPEPGMFEHRDRWYLMMGVNLDEYRNHMRRRSEKWETVALPAEDFGNLPGQSRAGYDR